MCRYHNTLQTDGHTTSGVYLYTLTLKLRTAIVQHMEGKILATSVPPFLLPIPHTSLTIGRENNI
jgi:hypothetical protein